VKIYDLTIGIAQFLAITVSIIPPSTSIPKDNGITSSNNNSAVFAPPVSVKIAAYTAAPYAIASSGLIDLFGSFLNKSVIN